MNHAKTTIANHRVKRLVWSSILITGLIAGLVPQAKAHDPAYKPSVYYDRHVVIEQRQRLPRRLRKNIAFRRWYLRMPYYRTRHISWKRLYNMYLHDRYYHRHRHNRVVDFYEQRRHDLDDYRRRGKHS